MQMTSAEQHATARVRHCKGFAVEKETGKNEGQKPCYAMQMRVKMPESLPVYTTTSVDECFQVLPNVFSEIDRGDQVETCAHLVREINLNSLPPPGSAVVSSSSHVKSCCPGSTF